MTHPEIDRRAFLNASAGLAILSGCAISADDKAKVPTVPKKPELVRATAVQSEEGICYHPSSSVAMKGIPIPNDQRVTIDNYFSTPEKFRWSNLNGDVVFATLELSKRDTPVRTLPRRMIDIDRFNQTKVSWGKGGVVSALHWLTHSKTDALLAVHDGHIALEVYFGEMGPHTRHQAYSIIKPFLATAAANELYDGTIDPNRTASYYVSELSDTAYGDATVRQILDMQAGVEYRYMPEPLKDEKEDKIWTEDKQWIVGTEEYRQAAHESARYMRAAGFVRKLEHEVGTGIYDAILTLKKKAYEHGTVINYACPTTGAFQLIFERATNNTRAIEHLSQKLWSRLGVEDNALLQHDGLGTTAPNGGLAVTARDLARSAQMILDNGRVGSVQIVPAEFVEDLLKNPQREKANEKSILWGDYLVPGAGYRSYMFIPPIDQVGIPTLYAGGGYGQHCLIDPVRRNVIIKLSSVWNDYETGNSRDLAAIRSLSEALPELVQAR